MAGLSRVSTGEDTDQHRTKRQKMGPEEPCIEDKMDTDEPAAPSNHDRQDHEAAGQEARDYNDRGTELTFAMNQSSEEIHLASDEVSLEQLQKNMGDAFLLCKSSKTLVPSVC